jgi:general secretion pathway protein D
MRVNVSGVGLAALGLALALAICAGCAATIPLNRGQELARAAQWDEAIRYFQDVLAQEPTNADAKLGLARTLAAASEAMYKTGLELESAGRLDDAQAAYQRSLLYNAENTAALAGIGRLAVARQVADSVARARERLAADDLQAAQREAIAASRLDPGNLEARALLQQISARMKAKGSPAPPQTDGERSAAALFSTKPVTLRFRDTDIKDVLEVVSRTANVNILTDEGLQPKRISTYFKDLPLREAFTLLLSANRLFAKKVAENAVIVIPDTPAKRQQYEELLVQTFFLTDADAKVTVNLLRTILNTRQVYVNEKLNAIVVRDTPEKMELVKKLLEANDRGAAEVEVDLEVLEVDRTSLQNLGIDISPRQLSVSLTFPTGIPVNDVWNTIKTGSTLAITNPSLILNLAKSDGHTKILANPTVRILDRQKARLLIGERRPFLISSVSTVSGIASPTTPGTSTGTTTEQRVEYRDLGLKMTLTPTVHLNGEVTVEINFEVSNAGAPIVGVTAGQLLPPINTRNVDSFIKVRNGETRLLGGLYEESESVSNSKLPFLSELPGLGRLFMSSDENRTRKDVLIAITPRILKVLDRPDPSIESFASGTADSFGPPAPAVPVTPAPAPAPRPGTPGTTPGRP